MLGGAPGMAVIFGDPPSGCWVLVAGLCRLGIDLQRCLAIGQKVQISAAVAVMQILFGIGDYGHPLALQCGGGELEDLLAGCVTRLLGFGDVDAFPV
jgi:hypothetical protein